VTSASWNGNLATGASTAAGANFTYSGTNTPPAGFTVNGVPCSSGHGSQPGRRHGPGEAPCTPITALPT
jgi:endoglucanase